MFRYLRIYLTLCCLTLVLCCSNDSTIITTQNVTIDTISTFGGSKNESGQSVVATNDGGYAILGFTQSTDGDIINKQNEDFDFWLLKFDAENQLQWQKTFGGTNDDKGVTIIQTTEGGFAILGYSNSNNGDVSQNFGLQDFWILKLDPNGNIEWERTYGFQGADRGISLIQTNDTGFLLCGILDVTASGGEGNTSRLYQRHAGGDYWVLKLNTSGNLEWSKFFGGNFTDTPEGLIQTSDNNYIIVGGSDSIDTDISDNKGSYDFWVIKISTTGNLIWEKSFGGSQIDEARAIIATEDGNFLIAGDTRSNDLDVSNNIGAADLWLVKISTVGDLIWEKTIGGTNFDVARDVIKSQNNGYIIAGSSRSSDLDVAENKGQNDAWIINVDDEGNLLWEKSAGGSNIDFAYSLALLNDGSIIATGDSTSNDGDIIENKGFTDLLVLKMK
ncbi:hypothetical protein RM697_08000 [Ichthyenterobacterium sp. W332]|uniref:Bulb-type lectin domain-containing protein n=1 Tax=Microcosmobacter mediterraneus TaxID=3075607 RepID=A0ABU2YLK5_9FLAO|nr:hypothetical protein [Ichthyenterobacterium sp. W332]MDT0558584.1 hypothetical protein [Ichthyenterobacterium sp. W332]